jgi:hypothetical protein
MRVERRVSSCGFKAHIATGEGAMLFLVPLLLGIVWRYRLGSASAGFGFGYIGLGM